MHLVSGTTLPDFPLTLQFSFSFPSQLLIYLSSINRGLAPEPTIFILSTDDFIFPHVFFFFFYPLYTCEEIIFSPQLSSHPWIHISSCSFSISSTLFIRQVNLICPTPSSWFSIQLKQLYHPPLRFPISITAMITQVSAHNRNQSVFLDISLSPSMSDEIIYLLLFISPFWVFLEATHHFSPATTTVKAVILSHPDHFPW